MRQAPLVLLVPSMAAAVELPRRLAASGRALAGIYPFKLLDLARAIAEPILLGRGLKAWDTGHEALLAAQLLDGPHGLRLSPQLPLGLVAVALARTLASLRQAGVDPGRLEEAAGKGSATNEDQERRHAVAALFRRFHERVEGRFADPAMLLRTARDHLAEARWLEGAEMLLVADLELEALEKEFLEALGRVFDVRLLEKERPPALATRSFAAWARARKIRETSWAESALAPLAPPTPPAGLRRLRASLFEPPSGESLEEESVELWTAPGEAAEVRSIARRLLREAARGVPFEEMGIVLPRPQEYAPLFTDLFERLGIPHRLHPSLPLRFGRAARALLLLFRSRGLERPAVMEFLTFAPVPFAGILGDETAPRPAQWDEASRNAGVTAGLKRWRQGLTVYAETKRAEVQGEENETRRAGALRRAGDAEALLRVVEALAATLDRLSGQATWPEWSARVRQAFDQWIGPERDRAAVADLIADLAGLSGVSGEARWDEVEGVLAARLAWERLPLEPLATGAVHVGALDAIAGLSFRVVAIPGLVEGGYPGVLRPDPFLLDAEREALTTGLRPPSARPPAKGQLSLFDDAEAEEEALAPGPPLLPTTQDRLVEARRVFHRAVSQATERLILSYPRADPRTGRERMPSLFFVAAASALAGRPLDVAGLARRLKEDDLRDVSLEDALDRSERDLVRIREGGSEAMLAIAAGAPFFKGSILASTLRARSELSAYDGHVRLDPSLAAALDPVASGRPISASRFRDYAECGFLYLLKHVLNLEPVVEPEDRMGLEPMERGLLFHEVAEHFLRERRTRDELPVKDDAAMRERLLAIGEERLSAFVAGSPPRYRLLWEMERARFQELLLLWLAREAKNTKGTPAHFEVGFGIRRRAGSDEPHSKDPLEIDLGQGRVLRVSGKIDRIDVAPDGSLILRDYKTGKAPEDDARLFQGGRQLQIPFYVLAASRLFPGHRVVEAFLDYVNGGRQVAFDPDRATGPEFRDLLRELVGAMSQGLFLQDASACRFCDYTAVCGPQPLIEARQRRKRRDKRAGRVFRLKDVR